MSDITAVRAAHAAAVVIPITERVALRPAEAGVLLGLSRSKVYALIRTGQLHPIAGLRTVRIARLEVERFAAAGAPSAPAAPLASVSRIR